MIRARWAAAGVLAALALAAAPACGKYGPPKRVRTETPATVPDLDPEGSQAPGAEAGEPAEAPAPERSGGNEAPAAEEDTTR